MDIARYSKLISPKDTGHNEHREARLLERCPPGHEGKRLVDEPATILDASGAIIGWYLPDALTDTTQKEIREATDLLAPSLEKSVRADGNWRTNQTLFNQGSEDVGPTPRCINLSLAWFQQGHENVSDPEVSASLKGPSCKNILKAIARPAAIASAALRVMHPEQYWAGLRTLSNLGNIAVSKDLPWSRVPNFGGRGSATRSSATAGCGFRDSGLGAHDMGLNTVLNSESLTPNSLTKKHEP
ncbi:uncharacterized protein F5891DRAFT_937737 [Suillus fuscotomentosus]|uniref:Uncharacterized protein n=1 Tax=Suillus fuscotomentosus TaxID=1912939 RepID=A0AAD4EM88_9AGAM|nr:uncharacterized protein F5891DRAFT_937737 [Suillus fuscotomentosus]KAG1908656.1 hypothetical protein F5891DRAFT_937737 [Suillus fuscotomentosus]